MLQDLQEYALPAVPHLKVLGRTNGSLAPLTLFWTGSALEVNVRAAGLWAEVEADFSQLEQWAAGAGDGQVVSGVPLPAGRHWLCLFRGMDSAKARSVRLVKEVQAMPGDPQARLQVHALRTDGSFLPVEARGRRLEFIGDSITSGEGLVGAQEEQDWIPLFFSAVYGFPMLAAGLCGADYRVVSQSGWGVRSSWDNNPHCTLPGVYDRVCGPLTGQANQDLGAQAPYDFAAWQPDAVVINLGTNDGGAVRQPPWQDPATGACFQQEGNRAGRAAFTGAAVAFLQQLRARNPGAFLLWAYGMLGREMAGAIREAVAAYRRETGDLRADFLLLPDTGRDLMGSRGHPGRKAHAQAARILADYLETVWEA